MKPCPNCIDTHGLDVAPTFRDSGGIVARCTRPCHVCGGTMQLPDDYEEARAALAEAEKVR